MWYLDQHECALCALSSRIMELKKFGSNDPSNIISIIKSVEENYGLGRSRLFAATFEEETKLLGVSDPYLELKSNVEEAVEKSITRMNPSLPELIKMAAAANSVDAPMKDYAFDAEKMIERLREEPILMGIAEDDLRHITSAGNVVYVTDNAGEFAVDAALIKALSNSVDVTVISRSLPYETDVTAGYVRSKLPRIKVVETGNRLPAFLNDEIYERYIAGSGLVISKGVGNLEAYIEAGRRHDNALFLLRVKCRPFIRVLGVPMGKPIIASSKKINELIFKSQTHAATP
ncbi:MAG: ARMT1-like domain-containing protein [Thermocladium sp.]